MINSTTITKLQEMRLSVMAESSRNQINDQSFYELSFEERFGLVVDSEWNKRKNTRLLKLLQQADFSDGTACVEDIEYHSDRKLDKSLIMKLSTCNYIHEKHNIIVLGASGAGKSFIACALGVSACRNFLKTRCVRLPDLLNDIAVSRGQGTYKKLVAQLKKLPLLILDEWMRAPRGA